MEIRRKLKHSSDGNNTCVSCCILECKHMVTLLWCVNAWQPTIVGWYPPINCRLWTNVLPVIKRQFRYFTQFTMHSLYLCTVLDMSLCLFFFVTSWYCIEKARYWRTYFPSILKWHVMKIWVLSKYKLSQLCTMIIYFTMACRLSHVLPTVGHHAKFRQNWPNGLWDMEFFYFQNGRLQPFLFWNFQIFGFLSG